MNLEEILKRLRNNEITTLHLFYNYIGAARAKDIAEALKVNTSLTYLNLCFNHIGAAGAQSIAKSLNPNNGLELS